MADEPLPPADKPEDHPPQGGPLMTLVVWTICGVYVVSHLIQYLPYVLHLTAEQRAALSANVSTPDNLMIAAVSFFLGSSQGGRALMDRLSKRSSDS